MSGQSPIANTGQLNKIQVHQVDELNVSVDTNPHDISGNIDNLHIRNVQPSRISEASNVSYRT